VTSDKTPVLNLTADDMVDATAIVKAEKIGAILPGNPDVEALFTLRKEGRTRVIVRVGGFKSNRFMPVESGIPLWDAPVTAIGTVADNMARQGWGDALVTPTRGGERIARKYRDRVADWLLHPEIAPIRR